jgi:hypothetical protein
VPPTAVPTEILPEPIEIPPTEVPPTQAPPPPTPNPHPDSELEHSEEESIAPTGSPSLPVLLLIGGPGVFLGVLGVARRRGGGR